MGNRGVHSHKTLDEFLGDTVHDLPACRGLPANELADRCGRRASAQKTVTFNEKRIGTCAGGGYCSDAARHAAARPAAPEPVLERQDDFMVARCA